MSVEKYKAAIKEVFQSGFLKGDIVRKHIDQQVLIEKLLPDSASFFFVVEPTTHKYHFMGKQQESVTGYANDEAEQRGMDFFLDCLHPDEGDILVKKIYPAISKTLRELAKTEDIRKASTTFNYRFKSKNGIYLNLMEHLYVLEPDQEGNPALFLGNIVKLENSELLPLRLNIRVVRDNIITETILSTTYNSSTSIFDTVTIRELDILRHLATGKSSKQIGEELFVSRHTIDTHRRNLLKKLNCRSIVELTHLAYKNGVL